MVILHVRIDDLAVPGEEIVYAAIADRRRFRTLASRRAVFARDSRRHHRVVSRLGLRSDIDLSFAVERIQSPRLHRCGDVLEEDIVAQIEHPQARPGKPSELHVFDSTRAHVSQVHTS